MCTNPYTCNTLYFFVASACRNPLKDVMVSFAPRTHTYTLVQGHGYPVYSGFIGFTVFPTFVFDLVIIHFLKHLRMPCTIINTTNI